MQKIIISVESSKFLDNSSQMWLSKSSMLCWQRKVNSWKLVNARNATKWKIVLHFCYRNTTRWKLYITSDDKLTLSRHISMKERNFTKMFTQHWISWSRKLLCRSEERTAGFRLKEPTSLVIWDGSISEQVTASIRTWDLCSKLWPHLRLGVLIPTLAAQGGHH